MLPEVVFLKRSFRKALKMRYDFGYYNLTAAVVAVESILNSEQSRLTIISNVIINYVT